MAVEDAAAIARVRVLAEQPGTMPGELQRTALAERLPGLIADCSRLLDSDSRFLVLTVYAVRMSALAIGELLNQALGDVQDPLRRISGGGAPGHRGRGHRRAARSREPLGLGARGNRDGAGGRIVRGSGEPVHPRLQLALAWANIVLHRDANGPFKSRKALKEVPIMAVTAYASAGDEERIRGAGAESYVSKPISVVKFVATVEELLAARNAVDAHASAGDQAT